MRAASAAALSLCLLLLCSTHTSPAQEAKTSSQPVFEFHSGFWVNLHHFLYLQGRIEAAQADVVLREEQTPLQYKSPAPMEGLPAGQRNTWQHAVQTYAASWSQRDLLLNNQMVLINDRLAELEDCPDLAGKTARECTSGIVPELVTALDEAAPVYREHWWSEQDRTNRAWIAAMTPFLQSLGANLAAGLADCYQSKWPAKIHVDVVYYAGQQGAYTSLAPLHLTIASADDRNQDEPGFETLFYEASHVLAVGVEQAVERECRRLQKPIPRDLWNAILFYTTAEWIGRTQSAAQNDDNAHSKLTGQVTAESLKRRGWTDYQLLLERYWQRYLDGQAEMDTAVAHLVNAL